MFSRVRGTEDLLDLTLYNFALDTIKAQFTRNNFHEISTPLLEPTGLFIRSLGSETDVVTKEMYTFETKGGESICLRPESTASTMRAYLENGIVQQPWKVFSHGPMFRHERPQKGRWRQFTQTSIEIIGAPSINQDVLLISLLDRLFNRYFMLDTYVLSLNFIGSIEDRRVYRAALHKFVAPLTGQVCTTCQTRIEKNLLRIFDCKNSECQNIYTDAPKITDHLSDESKREWEYLQNTLELLSVNFVHNPLLVRGLDYYNKTVFEFSSQDLGAQNAFCGGGRYDGLAEQLGAKTTIPSLGASIGMGRLLMLLERIRDQLPIPTPPALHLVIPMEPDLAPLALLINASLQDHKLCSDILLEGTSLKSMMRKANKMGASFVLIIGHTERDTNTVTVKNMQTGAEQSVSQEDLVDTLTGSVDI